ncbi:MAG: citrate synthase [Nitrososphaerales archaeon]
MPKGLDGVIVATTQISKIDGTAGKLVYRGYDITQLAGAIPFESVVHLLWTGRIPAGEKLREFKAKLAEQRQIPQSLISFLKTVPRDANPLSVLRTAISILGLSASGSVPTMETGMSLVARFPTIVATYDRLRRGESPLEPRKDLGHAENYLYMLAGKVPDKVHANAVDSYLVLLADHGLNSSTFAARVAISTLTDVYSSIVAAIGTLKGPLHGGAPSLVWDMLQDIGSASNVDPWIKRHLSGGERIMGFGHRIYRTEDPRSKILKSLAEKLADPKTFELAATTERVARQFLQAEHPKRALDTNVEFYSSLVLNASGIPKDVFTATFACSRVAGWMAQIMEQLQDNRIIRPESEYVGPEGLKFET